jgi:hypothetical protein
VALVDWQGDGSTDECFGIAPGRTIWHAWRNSGAWKEMPNGGRADDTYSAYTAWDRDNARGISVQVYGSGQWGSEYRNGAWSAWFRCGWYGVS